MLKVMRLWATESTTAEFGPQRERPALCMSLNFPMPVCPAAPLMRLPHAMDAD
jgi:hypothetical protein